MSSSGPPLSLPPPRCITCGYPTAHLWMAFCVEVQGARMSDDQKLPVRDISDAQLVKNSKKTVEAQILDKMGVIRICCRQQIMTTPKEDNKVPFPPRRAVKQPDKEDEKEDDDILSDVGEMAGGVLDDDPFPVDATLEPDEPEEDEMGDDGNVSD